MQTQNHKLRAAARTSLAHKRGTGAVISLLTLIAVILGSGSIFFDGIIAHVCTLIGIFITPVMTYGLFVLFLRSFRGEALKIKGLFIGFQNYAKVLKTMLLMYLYIALWTLLLVVPGIVKAYSYAMTPYILYDHPEMRANDVIAESAAMMDGYKMRLFLMDMSFIGWGLLCILTLGVGFLWLIPCMQSARAAFYEEVREAAPVYAFHPYAASSGTYANMNIAFA
ncbi:MAG: DUF975 family protein [Bacteroidales bacterium]|nr:DUF975 family protein [Bacteroidales bacterium]